LEIIVIRVLLKNVEMVDAPKEKSGKYREIDELD
jgi:hypothetical protein